MYSSAKKTDASNASSRCQLDASPDSLNAKLMHRVRRKAETTGEGKTDGRRGGSLEMIKTVGHYYSWPVRRHKSCPRGRLGASPPLPGSDKATPSQFFAHGRGKAIIRRTPRRNG